MLKVLLGIVYMDQGQSIVESHAFDVLRSSLSGTIHHDVRATWLDKPMQWGDYTIRNHEHAVYFECEDAKILLAASPFLAQGSVLKFNHSIVSFPNAASVGMAVRDHHPKTSNKKPANHPMHPSGEVGRFQMDNLSSPPGDWLPSSCSVRMARYSSPTTTAGCSVARPRNHCGVRSQERLVGLQFGGMTQTPDQNIQADREQSNDAGSTTGQQIRPVLFNCPPCLTAPGRHLSHPTAGRI